VHGPEEFDRPAALKLGEKIARARFVAAVSEFSQQPALPLERARALAEAARRPLRRRRALPRRADVPIPATRRLVCVGRLCEQKGQLVLLEAAARLIASGLEFELVLAGDGELRGALEAAARGHGIEERVRITGWISNEEVRAEILAARALVLPSFAEGLPVVLMEALALGRPVISTFVAGIPELVAPGESGWLVPAGDVHALAAAMRAALEAPPDMLEQLGRKGAERVRARHDARREAEVLARLFGNVA
jgi:glycosyltransferase involved in cell wall biosynthesis